MLIESYMHSGHGQFLITEAGLELDMCRMDYCNWNAWMAVDSVYSILIV